MKLQDCYTHLTAIPSLPLPVHRRQEAVSGDDKLSMAAVGRRQLNIKTPALQRGVGVIQLQPQLSTCVAGAVVTDDVVDGSHTSWLNFPHALTPALCLQQGNGSTQVTSFTPTQHGTDRLHSSAVDFGRAKAYSVKAHG